jgi:hypothetical protein
VRAKPTWLGQSNADAGYDRGGNARRSIADDGGREFLLVERRGIAKQSRREKSKVSMVWKAYRSRLHKCNDFNAYGLFSRDTLPQGSSILTQRYRYEPELLAIPTVPAAQYTVGDFSEASFARAFPSLTQ